MKPIRQTLRQAGYVSAVSRGNGMVILTDEDGKREIWACNRGHASFGIKYKNTDLEFVSSKLN